MNSNMTHEKCLKFLNKYMLGDLVEAKITEQKVLT